MKLSRYFVTFLIIAFSALFLAATLHAKPRTSVKNVLDREENPRKDNKTFLALPYAFSTESMGVTVGVGGGTKGYGQEQLLLGAAAFASAEEAVGVFLGMWDYRPSFAKRFFFGAQGMAGHYPKQRAYTRLVFEPDVPRPGSNDSNEDQFGEDSGYDNWSDFRLEWVLPIGSGRKDALQQYRLKDGLLQSDPVGGESWNPMKSGVTNVLLRQFNRYRSFELDEGDIDATTHPVELGISYDNTDFPTNPSRGSSQYLSITHDFGWLESPDDWTFIEFEASKYFSLGKSKWARQRIVALNFWTGDSPIWTEDTAENGDVVVSHRPPFYEGGRVANEYNLSTLFEDWKVDGGVGLRFLFAGAVVRLDVGVSDESTSGWVMFGHPF